MIILKKIPEEVLQILREIRGKGFSTYLVGGCVRDLLLGKQPKDYDLCTEATTTQLKAFFPRVVETGLKHGTVTILYGDFLVEVTTFRVTGEGPAGDAGKRDFTINALLFDGAEVIDYVGGLKDLEAKILRAVGSPEKRFQEDPLRMLRAVRLSVTLGFEIEEETVEAIRNNNQMVKETPGERINKELMGILLSRWPGVGIRRLQEYGLLGHIIPELSCCFGFEQCNPHHSKDVFEHIISVLEAAPPDPVVRLAALLHDIGKPVTFSIDDKGVGHFYQHEREGCKLATEVLRRLKFDNKTISQVSILVREHMNKRIRKKGKLKDLIRRVGPANIDRLFELQIADELGAKRAPDLEHIVRLKKQAREIINREPLFVRDLAIDGKDLISMGVEPGSDVGLILGKLLERVLEKPEYNTRARLMEEVKRFLPR